MSENILNSFIPLDRQSRHPSHNTYLCLTDISLFVSIEFWTSITKGINALSFIGRMEEIPSHLSIALIEQKIITNIEINKRMRTDWNEEEILILPPRIWELP